jgi:hypothetical protein
MKPVKIAILAGITALALAGTAYAGAQAPAMHRMTVRTPDGGVAMIEYRGNVAPKVRFGAAPAPTAFFGTVDPFVGFDRISAAMNREMDVLLRQADMLNAPFATPLFHATLRNAPKRHAQSWLARARTNGFCMQSVSITQSGNAKPHVVAHTAGNCGNTGLHGTTAHAIPRNGHGMLKALEKAPARPKLPLFYEAGYKPH